MEAWTPALPFRWPTRHRITSACVWPKDRFITAHRRFDAPIAVAPRVETPALEGFCRVVASGGEVDVVAGVERRVNRTRKCWTPGPLDNIQEEIKQMLTLRI
ncbi:hypothetical protein GCM10023075_45700 [Streptosporangium album]